MVIGTALGWGNMETICLRSRWLFLSGFALTALPFLHNGYTVPRTPCHCACRGYRVDLYMDDRDNLLMLLIPGAMGCTARIPCIFWGSLTVALAVAGLPPSRSIVGSSRSGPGRVGRIVHHWETV